MAKACPAAILLLLLMGQLHRIEQKLDRVITLLETYTQNDNSDMPSFCTVRQAAALLQLSPGHIYRLVKNKSLSFLQKSKNGKILFSKEDLYRYLQNNK